MEIIKYASPAAIVDRTSLKKSIEPLLLAWKGFQTDGCFDIDSNLWFREIYYSGPVFADASKLCYVTLDIA